MRAGVQRKPGDPQGWKFRSASSAGLHTVVSPHNSECTEAWIFRLNLPAGGTAVLENDTLEMSAVVVSGSMKLTRGNENHELRRFDSFYLPAGCGVTVSAQEGLFLYVGGAVYEGVGEFFTRRCEMSQPLGAWHQIHGKPPYEREVFMTLDQATPASRLITGLTWGRDGAWTSWPPHQHEADLEEVYCYFDLKPPQFGLHLSYREPGRPEAVHLVSTGDCVIAPGGYHPTVAIPGMSNSYFWVLAARSRESRRYDLAVADPNYAGRDR
jgi:5-deoxy-glucuronate isomerase